MSSTTVNDARELLRKRLAELNDERKRLERALVELGGKVTSRGGRKPGPRVAVGGSTGKKRRRKGGRADQVATLVEKNPGIGASDIAKRMKIKPNYIYRVLGDLEKEGRVKKKKRQYFPMR